MPFGNILNFNQKIKIFFFAFNSVILITNRVYFENLMLRMKNKNLGLKGLNKNENYKILIHFKTIIPFKNRIKLF